MSTSGEQTATACLRVGMIGARGHVGRELVGLLAAHPQLELVRAWSNQTQGQPVRHAAPGAPEGLLFSSLAEETVEAAELDALVIGTPNGEAAGIVKELDGVEKGPRVVLDLSADHRFDATWTYGLPETNRSALHGSARISNPGCYATAMQLALHPARSLLAGSPHCFGVSGYSGAGSTPNERNDPERLAEGVTPYQLVGHVHEREVSAQMGRAVRFAPSVAPFERGIVCTALFELSTPITVDHLEGLYRDAYAHAPLVEMAGSRVPLLAEVRNSARAVVGGLTVEPSTSTRVGVVCVLDNLLKGAASQALQNLNLALGVPELEGIVA